MNDAKDDLVTVEEADLLRRRKNKVRKGGTGYSRDSTGPVEYNEGFLHDHETLHGGQIRSYKETLVGGEGSDEDIMSSREGDYEQDYDGQEEEEKGDNFSGFQVTEGKDEERDCPAFIFSRVEVSCMWYRILPF